MKFKTIKISDIVEQYKEKCGRSDLTIDEVCGISCNKVFFSPARQIAQDTSGYKIVPSGYFACNLLHVGRDKVFPVALNFDNTPKIVSSNYYVFKFLDNPDILKEYFFILLFSDLSDRYFAYYTEASVRDRLDWKTFCNTDLRVPPVAVQQKIIDVFNSLSKNIFILQNYNDTLKRLILLLMEKYISNVQEFELGEFIEISEETNFDNKFGAEDLYGISIDKEFCRSMTDRKKVNLSNFFVVKPKYFAYNEITSRNNECLSFAYNTTDNAIIVSNRYLVFRVVSKHLKEEFLYLYLSREEFDRFVRYNSWGCAREMFSFNDFIQSKIPIPELSKQNILVDLFYNLQFNIRKQKTYEKMKKQISSIVFKEYCV